MQHTNTVKAHEVKIAAYLYEANKATLQSHIGKNDFEVLCVHSLHIPAAYGFIKKACEPNSENARYILVQAAKLSGVEWRPIGFYHTLSN